MSYRTLKQAEQEEGMMLFEVLISCSACAYARKEKVHTVPSHGRIGPHAWGGDSRLLGTHTWTCSSSSQVGPVMAYRLLED